MLIWVGEIIPNAASQSLRREPGYSFNTVDMQLQFLCLKFGLKHKLTDFGWSHAHHSEADPYDQTSSQFGKTVVFSHETPKTRIARTLEVSPEVGCQSLCGGNLSKTCFHFLQS